MTIILDRVKLLAREVITSVTGAAALWAPSKAVGDGGALITTKITRGPTVGRTQVHYEEEPTAILWTVTNAALGQRLILGLTGARWQYDVEAGDDDAAARDGLLAAITAGNVDDHEVLPGVEITAVNPSSILLDADGVPGLLWAPGVRGGDSEIEVLSVADCEVETGIAECVLEFQAYARGPGVVAQALLGQLAGGLQGHDVKAIRERLGIAFRGSMTEPINLDAQAGADWESRAAARLRIALRSYRAVPVATIDTANVSINVEGTTLDFEVSP